MGMLNRFVGVDCQERKSPQRGTPKIILNNSSQVPGQFKSFTCAGKISEDQGENRRPSKDLSPGEMLECASPEGKGP